MTNGMYDEANLWLNEADKFDNNEILLASTKQNTIVYVIIFLLHQKH